MAGSAVVPRETAWIEIPRSRANFSNSLAAITLFAAPCSQTNTIFGGAVLDSCWAGSVVEPSSGTSTERMDRRSMGEFYQLRTLFGHRSKLGAVGINLLEGCADA